MEPLLKQKRIIKGKLTRLITQIDNLKNQTISISEIEVYEKDINSVDIDVNQLNNDILMTCSDAEYDKYENEMHELLSKLDKLKITIRGESKKIEGNNTSNNACQNKVNTDVNSLKLPRVELPVFTSNYIDWISFRDLFQASVGNNNTLSNSQKLQYLKLSVKGEAANLLQSIQISDNNYEKAWNALADRYENKTEIINAALNKLISQPNLKYESASGLRKLIDITQQCIDTLQILKQPVEYWDTIIIFLIKRKLDSETLRVWTLEQNNKNIPSFAEFKSFILNRSFSLASLALRQQEKCNTYVSDHSLNANKKLNKNKVSHPAQLVINACVFCKSDFHFGLFNCDKFLELSIKERWNVIKENKLCPNCLKSNKTHTVSKCRAGTCKNCSQRHNSLLCSNFSNEIKTETRLEREFSNISSNNATVPVSHTVLLPTAIVGVKDVNGISQRCRILIDSASQGSFITENCINLLKLKRSHVNIRVDGLSLRRVDKVSGSVQLHINSLFYKNANIAVDALIIPRITCDLPQFQVDASVLTAFKQLQLADKNCLEPGPIDILLGADVFGEIMMNKHITIPNCSLTAIESIFGWVIIGKTNIASSSIISNHASCSTVEHQLEKFWQIDEVMEASPHSEEENACENHFKQTFSRNSTGRFAVKFPFRESSDELGSTRDIAVRRLQQVERRFIKNKSLSDQYHKFMEEYQNLEHMELIPENEIDVPANSCFYLPHHSVPNKSSDKFRVVFDGSAKSSSGISLNDKLMVGPQLQNDLTTLLIRFRCHKIALTADIEKMYRQIILKDSDFQRIVWRNSPYEPIQDFRLTRIAYGTASAPYLATKCLQQLAAEEAEKFPLATEATLKDFYIDDLMSGADSIPKALELHIQLTQMLSSAGFSLRKWNSNSSELLRSIDPDLLSSNASLTIDSDETVKTLGVLWHPTSDVFLFKVTLPSYENTLTKRSLLSIIARLFDPMGWLSPITVKYKLIMQELWKRKLQWDETIPPDIASEWTQLTANIQLVKDIKIPRYLFSDSVDQFQLHGFSDASERAYAAVIYCRSVSSNGLINVQLLISKTRVAPVKTLSLPRLELCGALLLTKLMAFTCKALDTPLSQSQFYTDSTIVLAWISCHASKWKTFVANRVAKIQNISSFSQWHHINGDVNPADLATRGMTISALLTSSWLHGPNYLHQIIQFEPCSSTLPLNEAVPEQRLCAMQSTTFINNLPDINDLLNKYSSLSKLKRVMSFCLRFITNCKNSKCKSTGFLKTNELNNSMHILIKLVQLVEFNNEINALTRNQPLSCRSKILSLNPFLDNSGILRVGGRLRHANIPYSQKHPILLPKRHILTDLIVRHYHQTLLHAGPQLLQSCIQEHYWIIGAKDVIRHLIRKCVKCCRIRASVTNQMMSDLPSARISPAPPFLRCGVDYAGPFQIKTSKGRGSKSFKAYLALFVCFTTRAIHLELVTDLSADAFIAALKRFISRRGKCSDIYSDCGSNFVGAKRKLMEFEKMTNSKNYNEHVNNFLVDLGIRWHFNVPGAPHMGGLWEAGIKSTKFHLKRVVGEIRLTYEEFETLITQIEACLNSRPLTALSNDPNDLSALTPGHFIIGRPLTSIPEPNYIDSKISYLDRWQIIQKMVQQFWNRWHKEYLCRLQQRPKWLLPTKNLQVDQLCLVKDNNLPPTKWKLCRILQLHPGLDGNVRVVTVKTLDGTFKRNISKLCQLPI